MKQLQQIRCLSSTHLSSRSYLRPLLAGYKIPKYIVHLDEMPMTESGKVQKGQLREVVDPMIPTR